MSDINDWDGHLSDVEKKIWQDGFNTAASGAVWVFLALVIALVVLVV